MRKTSKIDVFILTGFLGAGKTTFLNSLLKTKEFRSSAVIINEFGETSLDHLFVEKGDDQIVEISNGCICCTVRGQLIESLEKVLEYEPNRIVIETTGLASPEPILKAIFQFEQLHRNVRFAGMVSVVDALNGFDQIERYKEVAQQVGLSDLIVFTKVDLEKERSKQMKDAVNQINPAAKILDKRKILEQPLLLNDLSRKIVFRENISPVNQHSHSKEINSLTLHWDLPIERKQIDVFLELLQLAHGDHILRIKGLVSIAGENRPLLIQTAGRHRSEPLFLEEWPDKNEKTRIVVFLENLDPEFVKRIFLSFVGEPQIDTADAQLAQDNPLSIPGFASS